MHKPAPELIEASLLGLAPGIWPVQLERLGCTWHRVRVTRRDDREIVYVVYRAADGRELHVAND